MPRIDLTDGEWNTVMQVLSGAPWNVANPLLMKLGEQLRRQAAMNSGRALEDEPIIKRTREMLEEKERQ